MTTTTTAPTATAVQTRTAPPRQAPPSRPAAAKPDAENGAIRFLIYLRLHWLTILFCGTLLGAGLAYAAWTLMPPKYESSATFQVSSTPFSVAGSDPTKGKTDFAIYLKTTAGSIKQQRVYIAALRDPAVNDCPTIQAEKDPFKFFDEKLVVETKEGSEFIRLSLQGENPADVIKIVEAISLAYTTVVLGEEKRVKNDFRRELETAKSGIEKVMKSKSGLQTGAAPGPLPMGAPTALPPEPTKVAAVTTGDPDLRKRAMFPILIQKVAKLETELPGYDLEIAAKKGQLEVSKKAFEHLMQIPPGAESIELAKRDPEYLKAAAEAARLKRDYAHKLNALNQTDTPEMFAMGRRVEQAEIDAKKVLDGKVKTVELLQRKPAIEGVGQEINGAQKAIEKLTAEKKIAEQQLATANRDLAETNFPAVDPKTGAVKKDTTMLDPAYVDYATHENLYSRVTAHLIAAELDASQERVKLQQEATRPMQKDTKKQIIGTIFAGLMGFVLVGALAVGYESRVRRVSSLGEMKTACATPVVAVVPWIPGAATARDPIKRADVNEAIDKLRAYFAQTWLNRGATTVAVTSALGDEGKSFTAFGLASSLAQAGYKTLLVDFDLREPSLHNYAGVPNTLGVCELLRGEADFRKTIQTLPNGLHFLSAGKWSDEARQAAVGGRLDALLLRLKEPFDCIVLHGHALLTAAESVEIARRAEVVLLCAQYRESRVPLLKRAAERIASMEIPYSGIVYVGASPHEALC